MEEKWEKSLFLEIMHKIIKKDKGMFVYKNGKKPGIKACIFIQGVLQFGYTTKTPVFIGGTYYGKEI